MSVKNWHHHVIMGNHQPRLPTAQAPSKAISPTFNIHIHTCVLCSSAFHVKILLVNLLNSLGKSTLWMRMMSVATEIPINEIFSDIGSITLRARSALARIKHLRVYYLSYERARMSLLCTHVLCARSPEEATRKPRRY